MRFRKFNHYIYNTHNNILSILPLISLSLLTLLIVNFVLPSSNGNIGYNAEVVYAADASNPNKITPTASLTVSNSGAQEINVQPDSGTIYSSHKVTIDSVNITNYTLSISGPATLSSVSGKTTISGANGASGNSLPDNTWGYNYNTSDITSGSSFASVNYSSFLGGNQTLESANGSPSSIERSLVLAAKFGDTAEPGHYAGQVNLSLTAVPKVLTTYTITYNANSGSGAPSNWSDSSYDDSYTTNISSTTPTRSGYTFLGWNTSSTATSANSNYAAGKAITLQSSSPTLNLYAIWRKTVTLTLNANSGSGGPGTQTCYMYNSDANCSITISSTKPTRTSYDFQGWADSSTATSAAYIAGDAAKGTIIISADKTIYAVWSITWSNITQMQQMTPGTCANAPAGSSKVLTDTRDNSAYIIKKIGDKCWMLQNLRIIDKTIYGSDVSGHEQDSNLASGISYIIPASSLWSDTNSTTQKAYYSSTYGAYYSWCTATANACKSATSDESEAPYDICPKGWQLPSSKSGTGTNDFAVVAGLISTNIAYNTNYWSDLSSPLFTNNNLIINGISWTAAGGAGKDGLISAGSSGYYWSRTVPGASFAYHLTFSNSNDYFPSTYSARYADYPIRCVAK